MIRTSGVSPATRAWHLVGLVLLAVNLRGAITGVPPLLDRLQGAFHLSAVEVGLLATLPVLCLGIFAAVAPELGRRFGTEAAVALSLAVTTAGIVLRVVPSTAALLAGTVVAGAGIAVGNALLPAVIKEHFGRQVGPLTGTAMMLMAASGALAAAVAVPIGDSAGWRAALAVWAVPSLLAAVTWGPLALRGRRDAGTAEAVTRREAGSLLRSPLAWAVAVFLGVVSLMFYVLVAWLPQILQARGFTEAEAGAAVSIMLATGIPLGFVVPYLASRLSDQRPLILAVLVAKLTGLGGILLWPQWCWAWILVLGVATGSAFPLAVTLLSLRSATASLTARLSGMAQTGGYLLAGIGPLAFGMLRSSTGSWVVPLVLLLLLVVPETGFGLIAARPGFVQAPPSDRGGRPLRRGSGPPGLRPVSPARGRGGA